MTQQAHIQSASPTPVNGLNFEQEVLQADRPVLIDVKTDWCGPCRLAGPVVHEIAHAHGDKVKVVEVDGDQSPELVASLGVRGFTTFIVYDGGQEVRRSAGFAGKRAIRELVGLP